MEFQQIEALVTIIKNIDPHGLEIGGGASKEAIEAIELKLGVKFCEDYKTFLRQFGQFEAREEFICGIWKSNPENDSMATVLCETKKFCSQYFDLGNATVLDPGGEEYYRIINHDDLSVYTYDRFSEKYEKTDQSVLQYILQFVEDCYELAQD